MKFTRPLKVLVFRDAFDRVYQRGVIFFFFLGGGNNYELEEAGQADMIR